MILRLHHAQITVPADRVEEARDFYCGVLGLKEIEKPESLKGRGGFWVELGDLQIHVGTEEGFDRLTTKAHLAYQVDNLDEWRQRLTELSLKWETGIVIPGYDRVEFRDPFGNRAEFIQAVGE